MEDAELVNVYIKTLWTPGSFTFTALTHPSDPALVERGLRTAGSQFWAADRIPDGRLSGTSLQEEQVRGS
ncbi:hypothetical protein FQA47_012978 [Oryzias melastigma]|uniref:Uncharacterized protein n=1 Tax=Oryzias melastigma TaxID=30732 RepID=A0A834CKH5_ORYME|nr:hypothetical protein FQA47_012978 [Oryzias melastigma]